MFMFHSRRTLECFYLYVNSMINNICAIGLRMRRFCYQFDENGEEDTTVFPLFQFPIFSIWKQRTWVSSYYTQRIISLN